MYKVKIFIKIFLLSFILVSCTPDQLLGSSYTETPIKTNTPLPTGSVSGLINYQNFDKPEIVKPLPGVLIALCKIPSEGLPDGPLIAESNFKDGESVCTMVGEPRALTDDQGMFVIEDVPIGNYVVLFNLSTALTEERSVKWDGIPMTKAHFSNMEVAASGKEDLWLKGGELIGSADYILDEGGLIFRTGNACSNAYGFCFSILKRNPSPVVVVEPGKTVFTELKSHFLPED